VPHARAGGATPLGAAGGLRRNVPAGAAVPVGARALQLAALAAAAAALRRGDAKQLPSHVPSEDINRSHTHTHTPTEDNPPVTDTHTHDKNNTPNPQTNTPHKHLTTLEGGATTVRATSHARVGGRAVVSVGGRVEVRRGLGRATLECKFRD